MTKRPFDNLSNSAPQHLPTGFENGVPDHMTSIIDAFHARLEAVHRCYFCKANFSARSAGQLTCRYHPLVFVNRGANVMGEYSILHRPPNTCKDCSQLHLAPGLRVDNGIDRFAHLGGCTPIDHCVHPSEIFNRPFVAVPVVLLNEFSVTTCSSAEFGEPSSELILARLKQRSNFILVHRARQLAKRLVIDIPGTAVAFTASITDIYEAMARTFGLESLDESVKEARLMDPSARSMQHNDQYSHRDARRKDRMRTLTLKKVLFAPFVIMARLDQQTPGSGGFKLV